MLGLLNATEHGALADFPTEDCCDWQWVDLLPNTTAMHMEGLSPSISSVVQPIDDWNRNLRLSMLFECMVGKGKLIVTSFDLTADATSKQPTAAQLRKSVMEYMGSTGFDPKETVTMAEMEAWVPKRYVAPIILNSPPATGDVADPGQVKH